MNSERLANDGVTGTAAEALRSRMATAGAAIAERMELIRQIRPEAGPDFKRITAAFCLWLLGSKVAAEECVSGCSQIILAPQSQDGTACVEIYAQSFGYAMVPVEQIVKLGIADQVKGLLAEGLSRHYLQYRAETPVQLSENSSPQLWSDVFNALCAALTGAPIA